MKTKSDLKEKIDDNTIKQALIKRALGYEAIDEVKEYSVDENENLKLTKKKITKKFISPDITAAKALLEFYFNDKKDEFENMSDNELLYEKERLLKLLKEESIKNEVDEE